MTASIDDTTMEEDIPADHKIPPSDSTNNSNDCPSSGEDQLSLTDVTGDNENENDGLPPSKYSVCSRMYARDNTGILYKAVVRKMMYGPKEKRKENGDNLISAIYEDSSDEEEGGDGDGDEEEECVWHYFVHFQGWNVKWDLWVPEYTLYEENDLTEEMSKQVKTVVKKGGKDVIYRLKLIEKEYRRDERKRNNPSLLDENEKEHVDSDKNNESIKAEEKKAKRKVSAARIKKLQKDDLELPRKQALADRIQLPFALKKILVDEWEVISQTKKVPNLPTTISIKSALDQYLESKLQLLAFGKEDSSTVNDEDKNEKSTQKAFYKDKKRQEYIDMTEGIAFYFDIVLDKHLLFRQEIAQIKNMQKKVRFRYMRKCEIYGCEYLLRMFVRLPSLLEESSEIKVEEQEFRKIYGMIGDLVRYLQQNQFLFFKQTYRKPKEDEIMVEEEEEEEPKPLKKIKTAVSTNGASNSSSNGNTKASAPIVKSKVTAVTPPSKASAAKKKGGRQATNTPAKKGKETVAKKGKGTKHKMTGRAKPKSKS